MEDTIGDKYLELVNNAIHALFYAFITNQIGIKRSKKGLSSEDTNCKDIANGLWRVDTP